MNNLIDFKKAKEKKQENIDKIEKNKKIAEKYKKKNSRQGISINVKKFYIGLFLVIVIGSLIKLV